MAKEILIHWDFFVYKHDEQPPTATIELFTKKIDSIRIPVSMDAEGKKKTTSGTYHRQYTRKKS